MSKDDFRINELTAALQNAEQKLDERKTLITAAIGQTEAARLQYEQANERAEALRRRLDAKDEQLNALRSQLDATSAELKVSHETIAARDERIATLEKLCEENDNALHAINLDVKRQDLDNPSDRFSATGMVLESLDGHGVRHQISSVTTTLGRSRSNDVSIHSVSVSRYHARIVVESGGAFLIDLQSTNGCSINGLRVSRHMISSGDVIGIGSAKFRLVMGVPLDEGEDRSMDETNALLDDAEIFSAVPRSKIHAAQKPSGEGKPKEK